MKRSPTLIGVVIAGLLAVLGCRPPGRAVAPPRPLLEEPAAPLDRELLADELRAAVLESYEALSGGYEEAYLDGLAQDEDLVLIDVQPEATAVGYDPSTSRLRRPLAERKLGIVSKGLEVHLSADLTTAWTYDELSYRVSFGDRKVIIPLRATAVYERRDGRWLLTQEHVSYGVLDEEAFEEAARGQAARPAPLGNAASTRTGREVRELLLRLVRDEDETRVEHVSAAPIALVVGSDPDRLLRGPAVTKTPTVRALFGYDMTSRATDLRVRVGQGGKVAWAAGNVTVSGTRDDRPVTLALRVTWVLEKADGVWRVVQTHASLPVSAEGLRRRILGDWIE